MTLVDFLQSSACVMLRYAPDVHGQPPGVQRLGPGRADTGL
jgi:hypothetical protein